MTKLEELNLLEQIDALIKSANEGDYIPMTFAGIVNVCRNNIENDFGVIPVQDMETYLEARDAEIRAHEETKRLLARERETLKEANSLAERFAKEAENWERIDHETGQLYCELEAENAQLSAEIRKLKAEIVRMRMERMTEADMEKLYDKMNEEVRK